MATKGEQAKALFETNSVNCAQAVLCAFAEEAGQSPELLSRLASGLGGGIGRLRETCGAVSGMCMAAGLLRGYSLEGDDAEKTATYAMVQELVGEFRSRCGSIVCRELLGGTPQSDPSPTPRSAQFYAVRPCGELVAEAADILERWLQAHPQE